jgi:glycogen operon protein
VSYNDKHNEANGEDNRDGSDDNRPWNCGAEGPTEDPEIIALRARQQRNFLTTLLLSQGTPMLLGGDEIGRTQSGNNNGWCQDNEISWYDWELDDAQRELHDFTKRLIALRREHPVFRRRQFLHGTEDEGSGLPDVWWFRPDGRRMTKADWDHPDGRVLGMFLNGEEIVTPDRHGQRVVDDSFILLFNASGEGVDFKLPPARFGTTWTCELRTDDAAANGDAQHKAAETIPMPGHSILLLRRVA